jgi:hypothetical protein
VVGRVGRVGHVRVRVVVGGVHQEGLVGLGAGVGL